MKTLIRCISAEEGVLKYPWPSILQQVAFVHNSSVNTSTKYIPYELMYGDKPKLPSKKCSPDMDKEEGVDINSQVEERRHQVKQKWSEAASQLEHAKQVYKRNYDIGCKEKQVRVGDYVYVKGHKRKTALDPLFIGPFEVVAIKGHTIQICDPRRGIRTIHLNNCCLHKQSQVVILPAPNGANLELIRESDEDGSMPDTVAIKGHTIQIRDPRRGIRTIHLNNCRLHKQSQVVILPATDGTNLKLIRESDEDGSMPDTDEIVTAEGGVNPCLPQPSLEPGLEDLSLPIALRKPKRHKLKDFGPDFVSS